MGKPTPEPKSTLKACGCALALCLALSLPGGAVHADESSPLLAYAQELSYPTMPGERERRARLQEAEHILQQNPPPEENCAQMLGAVRFAQIYEQLGVARSRTGDHEGAAEAYRKALECSPRDPHLHANLAEDLSGAGRHEEAREVLERGAAIDPDHYDLARLRGQVAFVQGRWADAIAHFRTAVRVSPDDDDAKYWQILLWLSQRRAGIGSPELANREISSDWPGPILETLKGERPEAELLEVIQNEDDELSRREMLTEALFYIGQLRLAEGQREKARRHFAAVVNLKVVYYIEYGMARAELAKMRASEAETARSAQGRS